MNPKKLLIVRILLILLTLAVMGAIFLLSADEADESNAKSDAVSGSLLYRILDSFEWTPDQQEKIVSVTGVLVRKTAHFAEYAALGFLLAGVWLSFYKSMRFTFFLSQLLGTLYAVSDEIHQYFVPGRSCQISDMLLDSLGVAAGIGFLLLIAFLRQKKPYRRHNRYGASG